METAAIYPSPKTRTALFGETPDTIRALLSRWNERSFRADQILEWIYRHGVEDFTGMSNLPKSLRSRLGQECHGWESRIAKKLESTDGTTKLLLAWADETTSECVLIPDEERRTACVSTQVGCPVGCVFCASGIDGLVRPLTAAQIVEQAMRVRSLCADDARLSHVVFMGLGEPLANYDATLAAVRIINAKWGLGIGARRITISTVGLPKQIRRLAEEQLQVNLALSLHAPTDELRGRIIPWAQRVPLDDILDACTFYFQTTGRELTLEYILLAGLNDGNPEADRLSGIARQLRANVNLLAYNPVPGLPYQRPSEQAMSRFLNRLRGVGTNAHIRRSRGLDIEAACGQLRRREALPVQDRSSLIQLPSAY